VKDGVNRRRRGKKKEREEEENFRNNCLYLLILIFAFALGQHRIRGGRGGKKKEGKDG